MSTSEFILSSVSFERLDFFIYFDLTHAKFRADLNKMLMSMSVGPFCDLNQDVDSKDWRQGAVVSLVLDENERECEFFSTRVSWR